MSKVGLPFPLLSTWDDGASLIHELLLLTKSQNDLMRTHVASCLAHTPANRAGWHSVFVARVFLPRLRIGALDLARRALL
jgi:hypothetical protein